jgi:hypothetical protein
MRRYGLRAALLLVLAGCGGAPAEEVGRASAERHCLEEQIPRGTPAFEYCVERRLSEKQRRDDLRRLYDTTIRDLPRPTVP